jgi:hypothetical protein
MARLIHTATGSPFQLAGMKTMLSATFVATSLNQKAWILGADL